MKNEQLKILGKLDKETLMLIKEDSEKYINHQIESENIIISKSTNILQIFYAIIISTITYFLTLDSIQSKIELLICAVFLNVFLIRALILLQTCIAPSKVFTSGTVPSKVLHSDVFRSISDEDNYVTFLKSSIKNLEESIFKNEKVQSERIRLYKDGINTAVTGLLISFGIFILLLVLPNFQFFLEA